MARGKELLETDWDDDKANKRTGEEKGQEEVIETRGH